MNKKAQAIVGSIGCFLIILVIATIIAYNTGYNKGFSNADASLSQELEAKNNYINRLENQLQEECGLNETLKELDNCSLNLENKSNELEKCQNSSGIFPLFWMFNIYLTEEWIFIINIYLIITVSLFTIKIIFDFGKK